MSKQNDAKLASNVLTKLTGSIRDIETDLDGNIIIIRKNGVETNHGGVEEFAKELRKKGIIDDTQKDSINWSKALDLIM